MNNFTKITNREQMKEYIKYKLGFPINPIILDDTQLDYVIDDCLLKVWRYFIEEGSFLHYFTFQAKAGQSEYCFEGMGIQDAYDVQMSGLFGGIATLFSPMNMFYNSWIQATGNPMGSPFPFGTVGYTSRDGGQLAMTEMNVGFSYLKTIERQLGKYYNLHWHPGREVLEIIPTPKTDMVGLVALYVREEENNLFNNPLVRDLMVAASGVQFGKNITLYTGQLPDGLSINGSELLTMYKEDYKEALESCRNESQPADPMIF